MERSGTSLPRSRGNEPQRPSGGGAAERLDFFSAVVVGFHKGHAFYYFGFMYQHPQRGCHSKKIRANAQSCKNH